MKGAIKRLAYRGRDFLNESITESIRNTHDAVSQLQLKFTYRTLAESGRPLPSLKEAQDLSRFRRQMRTAFSCLSFQSSELPTRRVLRFVRERDLNATPQICLLITGGMVCWLTVTRPQSSKVKSFTKGTLVPTCTRLCSSIVG